MILHLPHRASDSLLPFKGGALKEDDRRRFSPLV